MFKSISIDINDTKQVIMAVSKIGDALTSVFKALKNSDILEDARNFGTCVSLHIYNDGNDIAYSID
mgnify:CR=1 FL=1